MIGKGRNRKGLGGGMGNGGGQGQRPGQRGGRMSGPMAAGPEGFCVCPRCGEKVPHERGVPCSENRCGKCGSPLVRA